MQEWNMMGFFVNLPLNQAFQRQNILYCTTYLCFINVLILCTSLVWT